MLFCQISSIHQTVLLTVMFIAMLMSIFLLCVSVTNKHAKLGTPVTIVLLAVLFLLAETLSDEIALRNSSHDFAGGLPVPIWVLWGFTAGALAWLTAGIIKWQRYMKGNISLFSIKRAMDTLPAAVCFFSASGEIKLCNKKMYSLFRSIALRDLQTLDEFDAAIAACGEKSGIVRVEDDSSTFIFPNGSVWKYSRSEITADNGKSYTEILFTEITELYQKRQELKRQSSELKVIYSEIKRLSDNVLEMTRKKVILTAKTMLHDRMGVGIAAVKQILLQNRTTEENAAALELWKKAISVIKSDNEQPENSCDTADIIHDAAAVGIKVEITGEISTQGETGRLLLLAMCESLSNAANHAEATLMRISCEQTDKLITLKISNNGKTTAGDTTPRGGLKNLRRHLTEYGGSMEIQSQPEFMLTVKVPASLEVKI